MPAQPLSAAKATSASHCSPAAAVTSIASPARTGGDAAHREVDDEAGVALVGEDEVAAAAEDEHGHARAAPAQSSAAAERAGVVHAHVEAGRPADAEGGERGEGNVLARVGSHARMLRLMLEAWTTRASKSAVRIAAAAALIAAHAGCASLGGLGTLVQAPRFSAAEGRDAEIVLRGPSRDFPLGGAAVRLHARVCNPNPFGLTLSTLTGDLFLDGTRAAAVDFPLGLAAGGQRRDGDPHRPRDRVRGRPAAGPGHRAGASRARSSTTGSTGGSASTPAPSGARPSAP